MLRTPCKNAQRLQPQVQRLSIPHHRAKHRMQLRVVRLNSPKCPSRPRLETRFIFGIIAQRIHQRANHPFLAPH